MSKRIFQIITLSFISFVFSLNQNGLMAMETKRYTHDFYKYKQEGSYITDELTKKTTNIWFSGYSGWKCRYCGRYFNDYDKENDTSSCRGREEIEKKNEEEKRKQEIEKWQKEEEKRKREQLRNEEEERQKKIEEEKRYRQQLEEQRIREEEMRKEKERQKKIKKTKKNVIPDTAELYKEMINNMTLRRSIITSLEPLEDL